MLLFLRGVARIAISNHISMRNNNRSKLVPIASMRRNTNMRPRYPCIERYLFPEGATDRELCSKLTLSQNCISDSRQAMFTCRQCTFTEYFARYLGRVLQINATKHECPKECSARFREERPIRWKKQICVQPSSTANPEIFNATVIYGSSESYDSTRDSREYQSGFEKQFQPCFISKTT